MKEDVKIKAVRSLTDERALRKSLLILFRQMGFQQIEETHGQNELGRDIVFCRRDEIIGCDDWTAVVVKHGNIFYSVKSQDNSIITIINQVKESFLHPYKTTNCDIVNIKNVWVICNGNFSNQAKTKISAEPDLRGQVRFFADKDLVDLFDRHWRDYFYSDPDSFTYLSLLLKDIDFFQERTAIKYPKSVDQVLDVFVTPKLYEFVPQTIKGDTLKAPIKKAKFAVNDLLNKVDNYALFGDPGSGKTTLMRKLVRDIIDQSRRTGVNKLFPVTIRLRYYQGNLMEDIRVAIDKYAPMLNIDNIIQSTTILVFCDGLDEISKRDLRDAFIKDMINIKNVHRKMHIILLSRPLSDYDVQLRSNNIRILSIEQFEHKEIVSFINKWIDKTGLSKSRLLTAIQDSGILYKLPRTPMVLTLIAIIAEEDRLHELPANMADLYKRFFDVLLSLWDKEKGIEILFDYQYKMMALRVLATYMHTNNKERISVEQASGLVRQYLDERGVDIDGKKLIDEIEQRTNVIFYDDKGDIRFKHLSFQEYLCAMEMVDKKPDLVFYVEKAIDVWWEDVVFFMVGIQKDCPDVINIIMDKTDMNDSDKRAHMWLNMGPLLQASYLTNTEVRAKALINTLLHLPEIIEDVIQYMQTEKGRVFKRFSKFWLIYWMRVMTEHAYGSQTLKRPLEIAIEMINEREKKEKSITLKKADDHKTNMDDNWLVKYMMASALAKIGINDELLRLGDTLEAGDATLNYLYNHHLDMLTTDSKKVKILKAKIGKRINDFGKTMKHQLTIPANRLKKYLENSED